MKKQRIILATVMLCLCALSCNKIESEDWTIYSSYLKAIFLSKKITMNDVTFKYDNEKDTMLTNRFFGNNKNVVTIDGKYKNGRIAIYIKDTTARTYVLNIGENAKTLEVFGELLLGDTSQQDSVSFNNLKTEMLIFYYDNNGDTYYATKGYVNINYFSEYSTGNFHANMHNATTNKQYPITEGNFLIEGGL